MNPVVVESVKKKVKDVIKPHILKPIPQQKKDPTSGSTPLPIFFPPISDTWNSDPVIIST